MKHITQQFVLCLVALVFTATAHPVSAAPQHSGIQGQSIFYWGPVSLPPQPIGQPVIRVYPVATSFAVVSSHSGQIVAQISTDRNGNFSVALHPGRYTIVPADLPDSLFCSLETPEAFEVTVRPRQVTNASFTYLADCPGIPAFPVP